MALPLYLAATNAEMVTFSEFPNSCAYLGCHFSPYTLGLTNIPQTLPEGAILILDDRMDCRGHSPGLVTDQLQQAVDQLKCESILLDFQRPSEPESEQMVQQIISTLACPVAVTEGFVAGLSCPVFLAPTPLHTPLDEYLAPWKSREIWLEAALCQEDIVLTSEGSRYIPQFPPDAFTDGFYSEELCCHYRTMVSEDRVTFTLFDTPDSLNRKLELAHCLGVKRAVGLWQELRML